MFRAASDFLDGWSRAAWASGEFIDSNERPEIYMDLRYILVLKIYLKDIRLECPYDNNIYNKDKVGFDI